MRGLPYSAPTGSSNRPASQRETNAPAQIEIEVSRSAKYKTHVPVYDLVAETFGTRPDQVLFVSSNGWDAAAATGYGFETLWVNRAAEPMDRLPWTPRHVASDLTGIAKLARTTS